MDCFSSHDSATFVPHSIWQASARSIVVAEYIDEGIPTTRNFRIVDVPTPSAAPADGVLLQLLVISPDPFLRRFVKSSGGIAIGGAMSGFVAGRVLESNAPSFAAGDLFGAYLPFTTVQTLSGDELAAARIWKLPGLTEDRISLGVGVLGMPGSTAYVADGHVAANRHTVHDTPFPTHAQSPAAASHLHDASCLLWCQR